MRLRTKAFALSLAIATAFTPEASAHPIDDTIDDLGVITVAPARWVRGTIEIYSFGVGYSYAYRDFDPPISQWTCAESYTTPSTTCTPSANRPGVRYRCRNLFVHVEHYGTGAVSGSSSCRDTAAVAVSTGSPATGAASSGASDPFGCAATPPAVSFYWHVTCHVVP